MRSKKQFVAKPPDGTKFFIDRSLGVEPIRAELIKSDLIVERRRSIRLISAASRVANAT